MIELSDTKKAFYEEFLKCGYSHTHEKAAKRFLNDYEFKYGEDLSHIDEMAATYERKENVKGCLRTLRKYKAYKEEGILPEKESRGPRYYFGYDRPASCDRLCIHLNKSGGCGYNMTECILKPFTVARCKYFQEQKIEVPKKLSKQIKGKDEMYGYYCTYRDSHSCRYLGRYR